MREPTHFIHRRRSVLMAAASNPQLASIQISWRFR